MNQSSSTFDAAAKNYDQSFSDTCIGIAQREQVWRALDAIKLSAEKNVLELNCGTGEDAKKWKERGFEIVATDLSQGMLDVANEKFPDIHFEKLAIQDAPELINGNQIVFSNFGGFNCLNSAEINSFFRNIEKKLWKSDEIILVIMGKKCTWDNLFLLLKLRFKEIGRRNTNTFVSVNVDGVEVKTYYYSPKEIEQIAGNAFEMISLKPIGLFVPPSYLWRTFERKKIIFGILEKLDRIFNSKIFANRADHFLISLRKK